MKKAAKKKARKKKPVNIAIPVQQRLVTAIEAAQALGVTRFRIWQLCAEGRITGAHKRGRDWLIPWPVQVSEGSRGPRSSFRKP